jgi:hypothetical protein
LASIGVPSASICSLGGVLGLAHGIDVSLPLLLKLAQPCKATTVRTSNK